MKLLNKIKKFLFNAKLAFSIFSIFIIIYIIILAKEGAFVDKFLNFGPSKDTKFIHMTLDTWPKVISIYCLAFFASFLTEYYNSVSFNFIHSYIWNPAYTKEIETSKTWTTIIVAFEPLLYWILTVVNFFINLIIELQFLVPKFLGRACIKIPYGLYIASKKKYIS